MRQLILAAVFACSCTSVDPFVGSYNVTLSGADTQTAPTTQTNQIGGMGYMVITGTKDTGSYKVHFGQDGQYCSFNGKEATEPLTIDIPDMQSCVLNNFTFVTTDGKVTMDKETQTTATLVVSYTYSGQLVFNFSGTGTRTYTGARL